MMAGRFRVLMLSLMIALVSAPAWAQDDLDPWEDFNRKVFAFNETADRYVLRPVASGYRFITPRFVRRGVTNVFNNIKDVPSAFNGLLQGKPGSAGRDLGRFLINSTDRKSTRLNSSHVAMSYAVVWLKNKITET